VTADEAEIAQLAVRFADAVTRAAGADFAALWAPVATWRIEAPANVSLSGSGADFAAVLTAARAARWRSFVQLVHGTVAEVEGDLARSRSYVTELATRREGGPDYRNVGTYADELRRIDGVWRYTSRQYHYLHLDTAVPT
jgi:hypothetical protein